MTRGERVCGFIEKHCIVPEGDGVGKPFTLEPFQRRFILAVYDNPDETHTAILSIARKNGKTGLIAALVLCHVAGPEAVTNSQIVSGATSRDQAALVYDYATKIVRQSPTLAGLVKLVPSRKRMYGLARNVEFRALAADAKRIHGISPIMAILDEVGQIKGPRSDFVDAIVTAQGAYDSPLLMVISTQAASDTDLLSTMIDDAASDPPDPHVVCHVYAAAPDCAVNDEKAWTTANPALGKFRSEADMRKLAEKAARMPAFIPTFRNLNLNQRVEMVAPFIIKDVWKRGDRELIPHNGEVEVWAGLDLSSISDLTALVAVWKAGDQWNAAARFWAPAIGVRDRATRDKAPYDLWAEQGFLTLTPGGTVDYDFVAADLLEMASGWNLQALAFDRWRIEQFKAALTRQDAPDQFLELMRPFGQGFQSMSPALDALETEILANRLAHAANPILAMCSRNSRVVYDAANNRKLDKQKSTGRIDGLVALAMAFGVASAGVGEKPQPKFMFL